MKAPDFPDDSDDYDTIRPESVIPEPSDEELEEVDAGQKVKRMKALETVVNG